MSAPNHPGGAGDNNEGRKWAPILPSRSTGNRRQDQSHPENARINLAGPSTAPSAQSIRRHRQMPSYVPPVYHHERSASFQAPTAAQHRRDESTSDAYFLQSPHQSPVLDDFGGSSRFDLTWQDSRPALDARSRGSIYGSSSGYHHGAAGASSHRRSGSVNKLPSHPTASQRFRDHRRSRSIMSVSNEYPQGLGLVLDDSSAAVLDAPSGPGPLLWSPSRELEQPSQAMSSSQPFPSDHLQQQEEALFQQRQESEAAKSKQRSNSRAEAPTILTATNPMAYGEQRRRGLGLGIGVPLAEDNPQLLQSSSNWFSSNTFGNTQLPATAPNFPSQSQSQFARSNAFGFPPADNANQSPIRGNQGLATTAGIRDEYSTGLTPTLLQQPSTSNVGMAGQSFMGNIEPQPDSLTPHMMGNWTPQMASMGFDSFRGPDYDTDAPAAYVPYYQVVEQEQQQAQNQAQPQQQQPKQRQQQSHQSRSMGLAPDWAQPYNEMALQRDDPRASRQHQESSFHPMQNPFPDSYQPQSSVAQARGEISPSSSGQPVYRPYRSPERGSARQGPQPTLSRKPFSRPGPAASQNYGLSFNQPAQPAQPAQSQRRVGSPQHMAGQITPHQQSGMGDDAASAKGSSTTPESRRKEDAENDALMDVPSKDYPDEVKNVEWTEEGVRELLKLLEPAERFKWKYVSDMLSLRQNKRIPLRACKHKFEALFGEAENSSALQSSLFYVAYRSGWDAIRSARTVEEQEAEDVIMAQEEAEKQQEEAKVVEVTESAEDTKGDEQEPQEISLQKSQDDAKPQPDQNPEEGEPSADPTTPNPDPNVVQSVDEGDDGKKETSENAK